MKKILVLSPHTDDAELGAGGTIQKYIEQKKEILWVVFSTAEESLPEGMPKNTIMIGDSNTDKDFAENCNINFFHITQLLNIN